MTLKRACTLMTVKSVNEDDRIITGIASTPSPDRDGDIMEPEGAKFRSDTPFATYRHMHTKNGEGRIADHRKAGETNF